MGKNLQFVGIEELGAVLDGLAGDKKLSKQVVGGILRKAAKPIVDEAKRLVAKRSGDVEKSIGIIPGRGQGKGEQVYIGPRRGGRFKGYVGHLLEYGTAPHVIKAKAAGGVLHLYGGQFAEEVQHPGTPAQPFMRPAYDAKKGESVDIIKGECRQIIESEFTTIKF